MFSSKKITLFISILFINGNFFGISNNTDLDKIALKYGTDKSSEWHNYTDKYEKYFEGMRHQPIKLLEIGLAHGRSAHAWEEYFTKADLHFIDISQEFLNIYKSNASERCHLYLADQSDEKSLQAFLAKAGDGFDIIIDDGGHTMLQQITSFKVLFPQLNSGGIYVIEDLATSFLADWGGYGSKPNPKSGPGTTMSFLQQLIEEINSFTPKIPAPFFCANYQRFNVNELTYYQQHIESIHCYNCLVFIFKR